MSSPPKRLILAIDGTWVNSDNGYQQTATGPSDEKTLVSPSNITRLCRALLPRSPQNDDIEQIVYYQAGLGSSNNTYSFIVGGYLGAGIDEAIREAYGFLANNYEPGDEIFLIGFSRGAFTARSIGGLIADVGILTKKGMESFYPIFMDWENQNHSDFPAGGGYGTADWPSDFSTQTTGSKVRPKMGQEYMYALAEKELTRPNVPVKAIAVFDTVGVLGVPDVRPFSLFTLYDSSKKEYSFVNTQVACNVENAYQALALDERRDAFMPTVWESPRDMKKSSLQCLKQCWFPGVHTSIGGGFQDTSISDLTLAWMMTQLSRHLDFDPDYLLRQRQLNEKFYNDHNTKPAGRGYGLGLIKDSGTGLLNVILGHQNRSPGEYHLTDPKTGKQLPEMLQNTCEFIHPSVRYRIEHGKEHGAMVSDDKTYLGNGAYEPVGLPLKTWKYIPTGQDEPGLKVEPKWAKAAKWVNRKTGTYIVEDRIVQGSFDKMLTDSWAGVDRDLGI